MPLKCTGLPLKKNVFAVLILEGNGAIKGIGLLFLSLYLVVVTAPPADLGKGTMVARECRREYESTQQTCAAVPPEACEDDFNGIILEQSPK